MPSTTLTAQAIDDALAGSFPASDPPAWTPGMARPAPELAEGAESDTTPDETNDQFTPHPYAFGRLVSGDGVSATEGRRSWRW